VIADYTIMKYARRDIDWKWRRTPTKSWKSTAEELDYKRREIHSIM